MEPALSVLLVSCYAHVFVRVWVVMNDLHHCPFLEPGTRLQLPGYPLPGAQDINYDLRAGEGVDGWVNNQRPLSLYCPMVANLNCSFAVL